MDDTTLTEDKLESYFSKSIAKQIIDGEGHKSSIGGGNKALDAKDMKVGGTFHKTFYNKKVPSGFKKLIKRFGGSVSHDKFRHSIDITPDIAKGFSGPQETFSIVEYVDKVPEKVKREVIKPYERRPAKFYRKAFVPISTRLGRIHPRLKFALRKFEKSFLQQNESDLGEVEGFLNAVRKLSDVDRFNLDMALFNGDFSKVNEIAIKNGFKKDVTKLQIVLDGIYQRALENGMDVSFIENYYPRRVKDLEALKESMGTEQLGAIEKAWADYAKKKGVHVSDLDAVVKTGLVNQVINRNISTLKTNPDNSKARSIAVVTPDMMENYSDSLTSLIDYIETMNESMAMKKLLGQDDPLEIKEMFPGAETERLDAITRYVAGMVEQYKLTPQQQEELTGALRARFTRVGTGLGTQVVKDITYMMTLGSPTTTVTQLGDLFFSLGQAGIIPTSKAILNVLSGKAKTNRKKLGLNTIAQEFKDTRSTARALNRIFKLTGFSAMDGFFKDVIIDAELNRMKSVLTSKGENRFTKRKTELENHLKDIFGGEYESVRADIINGEMSENVEMLLFSTLSDYHPVTLSEMPETYLKTSGGRIFYQLKTFTMKQLDTFRTRAYDKMKSGDPDDRVRGLANLLRLGVWFIISGWTADNIKDWMMNREIHLDDTVYDQMFKLIGSSRYIAYQARRHGPEQAIVKQFAPPQLGLAHDFWRDVKDLIKEEDPRDFHEIRAVAKIPVIGKLFYGWYGGGSGEFKTERELSRWTRVSKDRALNRKEQNKYFDVMMNAYSNGEISKRTFDNHYDKMIGLSLEEND
jgi:hypothetical protein